MFSRFFIDRPIFAAVLSFFFVIAGLSAIRTLPVAQYPEIAPPVVSVTAVYQARAPKCWRRRWPRRWRTRSMASRR